MHRREGDDDAAVAEQDDDYDKYHTPHAVLPLENLIRIAESKGDDKRVSELSLRLAESYLTGSDGVGVVGGGGDDGNRSNAGLDEKHNNDGRLGNDDIYPSFVLP